MGLLRPADIEKHTTVQSGHVWSRKGRASLMSGVGQGETGKQARTGRGLTAMVAALS